MTASPHDRPTAAELIEAVREFLEGDVADAVEGRLAFHVRVATNVLAMVERELARADDDRTAHAERMVRLGVADDVELVAALRAGRFDDRLAEVADVLWDAVVAKVEVANPRYLAR
jgi:hypothetical protein